MSIIWEYKARSVRPVEAIDNPQQRRDIRVVHHGQDTHLSEEFLIDAADISREFAGENNDIP